MTTSIFPESTTSLQDSSVIISERTPEYGKSYVFDFSTGEFKKIDGKVYVAEGVQVLKNWIEKTLKTERYRFPIYSYDYGVVLEELMAKDITYAVLINELEEQIKEALLQDIRISKVDGFEFTRSGDILNISFEVTTFDDETLNMEVSV